MNTRMKTLCTVMTIALLPVVTAAGSAKPEEDPPRIVEIRTLYQQVIADRDAGVMVCDRYEHNAAKLVLPGSGGATYRVNVWRYDEYLWQNARKGAVPKSWLAQVAYSRGEGSDEAYEFLFDEGDRVVFFCQSAPKSRERRYYLTAEKPVRVVEGKQVVERLTAEHRYYAEAAIMRNAYELKRCVMPVMDMR